MRAENDSQGQEIWSYYNGGPGFEVFERDDGFVNAVLGAKGYFADYKDWTSQEKKAIKYARGRCLDIGCGAGRVALHLQKKGIKVTATDVSPLAIKVCRLRGVRDARVMRIEDSNLFKRGSFDTVLLFGNGISLLQSERKAGGILKALFRITKPDGIIIAESRDPYKTDNPVHFKYHRNNVKKGRMPGQLREKVRFLQYSSGWFDALFASKNEVKNIVKGSGWKIDRMIDSPNFRKDGKFIVVMTKERR